MGTLMASPLYLVWNVSVVVLLVRMKYHRSWRWLVGMIAVNCWQIGAILAVPLQDGHIPVAVRRVLAIHWWLPGEALLLALTVAAIIEALWRALKGIPDRHKVGVCLSLAGGLVFVGSASRGLLGILRYSDWYRQLIADRVVVNLCVAAAALIALGLAETFHRHHDPRYVRMHCGLLAVLAGGHVLLGDMLHWQYNNQIYRALESACLLGWMINASLLRREISGLRTSVRARVATPHSQSMPVASGQSPALAAPASLAYRLEGSRAPAWMPASRAGTR